MKQKALNLRPKNFYISKRVTISKRGHHIIVTQGNALMGHLLISAYLIESIKCSIKLTVLIHSTAEGQNTHLHIKMYGTTS